MFRHNCTLYLNFCPLGVDHKAGNVSLAAAVASGYSWPIVMLITLINFYCQMKTPPDRAGIIFEVGAQLEARERHKKWSGAHRHYC